MYNPAEEEQRKAGLSQEEIMNTTLNEAQKKTAKKAQKKAAKDAKMKEGLANANLSRDAYMNSEDKEAERKEEETNKAYKEFDKNAGTSGKTLDDFEEEAKELASPEAVKQAEETKKLTQAPQQEAPQQPAPQQEAPQQPAPQQPAPQQPAQNDNKDDKDNLVERVAEQLGVSKDKLQGIVDDWVNGKYPKGSKPYFLMQGLMTVANNIMKKREADKTNSMWSTIKSGNFVTPEYDTNFAGLDYQKKRAEQMGEIGAKAVDTALDKGKQADIEGKKLDNREKELNIKERELTQEDRITMSKLNVDRARLENEIRSFDKLEASAKSKYFEDLAKTDADMATAILLNTKYGDIQVDIGGIKMTAAAALNAGKDIGKIIKAMKLK